MNERQKKKLVELNQGQTVSEKEIALIFLASALALTILTLFLKDYLSSKLVSNNFRFECLGFILGIIFSLINLRAWACLIKAMSKNESAKNFLVLKSALIAGIFAMLYSSSSAFILSALGGFLLHIFGAIFLIITLYILRPYLAPKGGFT
jgi:hypothetical protein